MQQIRNLIRRYPQLFSEYDENNLTASIENAIDSALEKHLLFTVSDDTARFVESFLKICGVEFIGDQLENDFISLTPLGISYFNQIYDDIEIERLRILRLHYVEIPLKNEMLDNGLFNKQRPAVIYSFAHKLQEGINKSCFWQDQTEYLISETEADMKEGLDDNAECWSQCGEFFSVNSWATQWWDVHHKGIAVPVCPRSENLSSCLCPETLKSDSNPETETKN